MRIIAGEARGRTLIAPKGDETRPTSDKIREALFSILRFDVHGARVLDLFGGTGALALEAISRGAYSAVISDVSASAAKAINANIEAVTKNMENVPVRFIKADYRRVLETVKGEKFDLIFLDPPYRLTEAYDYSLKFILDNGMLTEDGKIVAELQKEAVISIPDSAEVSDTRVYRDTRLDFIVRR